VPVIRNDLARIAERRVPPDEFVKTNVSARRFDLPFSGELVATLQSALATSSARSHRKRTGGSRTLLPTVAHQRSVW
jgi:hypothetical protein